MPPLVEIGLHSLLSYLEVSQGSVGHNSGAPLLTSRYFLNAVSGLSDQRNAESSLTRFLNGKTVSDSLSKNMDRQWHTPRKRCTEALSVGTSIFLMAASLTRWGSAPLWVSFCPMKVTDGDLFFFFDGRYRVFESVNCLVYCLAWGNTDAKFAVWFFVNQDVDSQSVSWVTGLIIPS